MHNVALCLQGWQQERQHSTALQKELDFFKSSSAQAIEERDRAAFDAQACKSDLTLMTAALQDTKAQLVLAQQLSRDVQVQLASVQQQLEAEQWESASCRVQLKQQKQQNEQQLQQCRQKQEQQVQELQQKERQLAGMQVGSNTGTLTAVVSQPTVIPCCCLC